MIDMKYPYERVPKKIIWKKVDEYITLGICGGWELFEIDAGHSTKKKLVVELFDIVTQNCYLYLQQ